VGVEKVTVIKTNTRSGGRSLVQERNPCHALLDQHSRSDATLALVPTPAPPETHRPVPQHEIVQALIEILGFRHIGVVHDEYAVSPDGKKAFGVLDLATEMAGCRFSIGLRNSHDKSMRLAMTCGYRIFVCSNMALPEILRRCSRNTRSRSRSSTAFRSELIECNATLSRCESGANAASQLQQRCPAHRTRLRPPAFQ
jgi:hypothetical protein